MHAVLGQDPRRDRRAFDSVYASTYKGPGGIAGACLAGEADLVAEARVWRKRHGGTLFALWPHAASGLAALRKRLPLMPRYYEHALEIAGALRSNPNIEIVPDPPQSPMMHLRVTEDAFHAAALRIAEEQGIFTWAGSVALDTPSMRGVELTVGDATMTFLPSEVAKILEQLT